MNKKEMIASIVTTMLVMTMLASSAMAITVDGVVDPAGEWDGYDEKISDAAGDTCSTGYDITSLWTCVEGDTLYIRMDIKGVPGDADTDGDPDTYTNTDTTTCGCPETAPYEYEGVGIGADPTNPTVEEYIALIDGNNDGDYDYSLKYQLGTAALYASPEIADATTAAAHGTIVELSVKIDQYCDIDPTNYCVKGSADTDCFGNEDYTTKICHFDKPPVVKCGFTPISCGHGVLSGTGSSDDGTIVEYAWDFYNDGSYDAYGENVSYSIIGTHFVRLMVTDDMGQTANCTLSAMLTSGPIADAKADGSNGPITIPADGKIVKFCGADSHHPDAAHGAHIVRYDWTILGVDYSTTDKDVCFDVFIDEPTTASLTVVDNFGCDHTDTVSLTVSPPVHDPPSDVPILTPIGMVALIGMLCIVGAGRILTKGGRL